LNSTIEFLIIHTYNPEPAQTIPEPPDRGPHRNDRASNGTERPRATRKQMGPMQVKRLIKMKGPRKVK